MIRHIDDLGRIVIPKEIRHKLDIDMLDELEIKTESGKIILSKTKYLKCEQCLECISKKDNYCRNCGIKIVQK